jgi:predicted HicB family RNase H-like nuclease
LVTKKAKVTIYIDPELEKLVRIAAIQDEKRFGTWVEEAFQDRLDKRRKERKKS